MPTSELDLWPDQISVDVVSPLALLRIQATALKRKTKGILDARVDSRDATMDIIVGYSE